MGFGSFARVSIAALSMSTLVLFAGCSGEEHLGPVPIQKSRIKISPSQLDFEAFADLGQLTATRTDGQGRPSNLNNFVWRSLSPTIAQVDGAGRVVSLGQGTAIIEVSVGGESTRAEVVVEQVPVLFAVGRQADTLDAVGQKVTLSLQARDRNGFRIDRRSVDWSSNDPGIVTIDELGEVTSQGEGETTVVVRKRWRKDSTRVRVRRKPNAMTVLPAVDTIHAIGSTLRLRAYLTDSRGRVIEDDFFAWSSSDPSTVSVNNSGRVTGVSAGAAQITARSSDLIGTAVIHVTPSAEQITITPSSSSIPTAGQTVQLSAQATDARGNAVEVSALTWASDRLGVAAVNSTGLVTGVGQGTARITATAPSGAKGFASVSVGQISLNVAPKSYTLSAVGDQTQLAIYPTDASGASATCPNPSWSSSNTKVASVNPQGVTAAKAVGTAMILVAACGVNDQTSITVLGGGGAAPPPPPPPPSSSIVPPDLPRAMPSTTRPSIQRTVRASNGSELGVAISSARAGDEILLDPGVTYSTSTGFTLPARNDGGWVMIRTDMTLPAGRVDSTLNFATIACSGVNCRTILADQPGDHGWWLEGVEIISGSDGQRTIVDIRGTGASVPDRFVFDRVYIHAGQASWDLRDCLKANGSNIAILRSVIVECHKRGDNSHAILAWNTPGPILIRDNLLSASTIPFLLGGADPASAANIPRDVTFAQNHVWRPNSWKGGPWVIKNLLELKMGIRVHVWGNVFENHWRHGQSGASIVLKTANQGCGAGAFTETAHVTFERNILRNVDKGLAISADPTNCGIDMHDVLISNVVCERCGPNGDHGDQTSRNFAILGATDNLAISRYTSLGGNMHTAIEITRGSLPFTAGRTLLVENVLFRGPTGYGFRKLPISDTYTNFSFTNAYAVGDNCSKYPSGWTCPTSIPAGAGADIGAVSAATAGVVR